MYIRSSITEDKSGKSVLHSPSEYKLSSTVSQLLEETRKLGDRLSLLR